MEIKPVYKQTEIGVIPEDWHVQKLGDLAMFRTGPFGSALHKSDYTVDGVPVVNPMHIIDGKIIPSRTMTITTTAAKLLSDFTLKEHDIVMGRRGDMGRCAVIEREYAGWLCGTGSLIIRTKNNHSPWFLQLVLSSPKVISAIEAASVGSTMINLNQSVLGRLDIQCPPLVEQAAIATALRDVDALITSLEQLIAKKRDIKQAAMQQFLTGKKRLPGFIGINPEYKQSEVGVIPGDWNIHKLGDCLNDMPNYGINAAAVSFSDKLPVYIRITDITEDGMFSPEKPVSVNNSQSANYYLNDGDLVFARTGASVGKSYLYNPKDGKLVFAGFLIRVKPNPLRLIPSYLSAYVTTGFYWNWVRIMSMRSGQPGINSNEYRQLPIALPPTIEEQQAIAEVLSDMDAEIVTLEQKRDKTRALKQGMMQELLTGKTRLI